MATDFAISNGAGEQPDAALKWIVLLVVTVIGAVNYGVRTSITAVFPLLKADLGFTDMGLGALGSFFLWSYALASPFAGHLGDRFDRGRIVLWSLIGWSLVTAASGLVTAAWQLLGMRVLLGLVESLFLPAALALIAEYHTAKTVGAAMGFMTVGQSLGLIGGATFQGFFADHYGWRPSLLAFGIAGLVIAVPAHFLLPRKRRRVTAGNAERTSPRPGPCIIAISTRLMKIPSFVVLAAAGAFTSIGFWMFANWLPLYFKESLGMSLASAGFLGTSFINGGSAISPVPGGMLSDWAARKGERYRMLLQGVLILAAAPMLLVFGRTKSLLIIGAALFMNSVLRNAADVSIQPLQCDLAGNDEFANAIGITNFLNCTAGGLGIFMAGFLKGSLGLAGTFAGTMGIFGFDGIMLIVCYKFFLRRDIQNGLLRSKTAAMVTPS